MQLTREALLAQTRFVPCFSTPVFRIRLAEAQRINATLKEVILAKEKAYASQGYSNFGGWHSGYSFAEWGGAALQEILEAAKGLASRATKEREGRRQRLSWEVKTWANVIRRGNANNMHSHVGCYWSGAYYVDTGDDGGRPESGGVLVFHDPRNGAVTLELATVHSGPETRPAALPEAGVLVLFPSWLQHSVTPYLGGGVRISVGVNLALSASARGLLE